MPMSTFDQDGDEAWRKCWVCRTRVYRIEGKLANDKLAPIHAWVEVNLSNGVIVSETSHSPRSHAHYPVRRQD